MRSVLLSCCALAAVAAQGQALNGTLTLSNFNGSNISCKGGNNGSINLTPTGGTPPYAFEWSNNATTEDISGLTAGYYSVRITDAANNSKTLQTTLTEPMALTAYATLYEYGNGYNVSLFNAFNGSITVTRTGGKTPYTQVWNDGNTQQNRTGVGADNYSFTITDANGCVFTSPTYQLTQPERTDWTMGGNAGTNPATQFIGTTDNKDLSFKTDGQERVRLQTDGDVQLNSLAFPAGYRLVVADSTGVMKILGGPGDPYPGRINGLGCPNQYPWLLCGNAIAVDEFIGTTNNMPLNIKTNGVQRIRVDSNGKVGIGTSPPNNSSSLYQLYVEGGIMARDIKVTITAFQDYVFDPRYEMMPMDKLREYIAPNHHLPTMPRGADVEAEGGIEVGDLQLRLVRTVEEQALYILQLEERLRAMDLRMEQVEARQR
ncbi:MAG: SprB repeat-containing protein [Flavobacteriales bacterium]|nr:MAG: SprB repeat-containing protein [Flavobacteriales bacterium]